MTDSPPAGEDSPPPLTASRWERLSAAFADALEQPADRRDAFVAVVLADDASLRDELQAMLAMHDTDAPLHVEQRFMGAEVSPGHASLATGSRVGIYRIDALIGEGGMAEVYRAERMDGSYDQTVALKVLRPSLRSADFTRRFVEERRILARLSHPDIVPILDGGETPDGRPYLVMPFVVGEPLTTWAARQHLSLESRLRLFVRVAAAVQFAHTRLVVHRDLKPSNILVDAAGGVRLLDFGIAKLLAPAPAGDDDSPRTRTQLRLLTPEHAAPEQLSGEEVTTATDVYALGVLLFELLTGRRPFVRGDRPLHAFEGEIMAGDTPLPSSVATDGTWRRKLRGDLDRIVLMALRREPERRYASAGQLGEDLLRWLDGRPVMAQPDRLAYRVRTFVNRNRTLVLSAAALVLLLAASALWANVQARRLARERDRSERERASADAVVALLTELFDRANPSVVPGGDTVRISSLLDVGEQRIDSLAEAPAAQARMWRVLGNMRLSRGEFASGKRLLERGWRRARALAGTDEDLEVARAYHDYARAVLLHDGVEAARGMLVTSRQRFARLVPRDHPDAIAALQDLVRITSDDRTRNALIDTLLTVHEAHTAGDSLSLAATFNVLGSTLSGARPMEALAYFLAAGRIVDRLLPPAHPIRLTVMQNTMVALGAAGDFRGADSLARLVTALEPRAAGTGGQVPPTALANRAILRAQAGDLAAADSMLRDALKRQLGMQSATHTEIPNTLRNLAIVAGARGRPTQAIALFDSALVALGSAGDTGQRQYLILQRARYLLLAGQQGAAVRDFDASEHALRARWPATDPRLTQLDFWQGVSALSRGDAATARQRFDSSYARLRASLPSTHPELSAALCGSAVAAARQGVREGDTIDARERGVAACAAYVRLALAYPLIVQWAHESFGGEMRGR